MKPNCVLLQSHYEVDLRARRKVEAHEPFRDFLLERRDPDGRRRYAVTSGEPVFDETLDRRLRQFQREQGLEADGVAGPATLMRLADVTDATAPRLAAARSGGEAN